MGIKSRKFGIAIAVFALASWAGMAQAGPISLFEYEINIDGNLNGTYESDVLPGSVDDSLFDYDSGLGTLTVSVSGAGAHYLGLFVDHEIDETINTFFNEDGNFVGTAAAGQSWEIDEPGYVDGDIFENFQLNTLDNGVGTSVYGDTTFPDDVSMALGWDVTLDATQTATATFILSEIMPSTDFFLTQWDPDSNFKAIYFSSNLTIEGGGQVPEPASVLLLGIGLLGLAGIRRRMNKA